MDGARDEFAARGCSVLVVVQAKPEALTHYLARRPYGVPLVCDPDRAAYRAFELARTPWWSFLRPRVVLGYLLGMLRGYAPWAPYAGEDVLQLGGDFVLDRSGAVRFAYRSHVPTDRPSAKALLAALPSPGPMGGEPGPDDPRVAGPAGRA